ncbi:uncharacterized protein [Takifugu rubripes]|uniref:uncharacterized protein n=1 Tax=Takifugu rubripes TaxID=31033 RepID=UPI001145DFF1|nr:uncharacterized protein LOC105416600 [Takifugu rubripes]
MEDVGNLRHRPAAAEKNPPTFAPKIHAAGMKPTAQTEEANRSPAPPHVTAADGVAEASGGVEVKSLEPGNQEEHEEVLGDERPEGGDVSTGSRTGTEENRRCSTDTGDVPAPLICPSKGQQMEKASPEEGKEPCDKTFWSTDLPSEAGASAPDSRDDGDVSAEVMREDAGCDVDDEEAALRSAEVSDAGSSLPWQRQDKTSQCVDEVSESSVNGLERPSPETGNPPEPHGATSCETSHLPPTRELGSAPDAAASATFPDPGVAPGPPVGDLQLSSFEPTQKKDDGNASSAGAGAESGISSLAVSPDAEADGNIFSPEPPLMAGDPQAISLYADDAALSAAIERMSGETLGPLQPCCSQMSHSTSWTVANEDAFGHEIEDGYHRLVEQFAAQIAVSVTSLTDQLTDVRAALEVVETRAKTSAKEKEDSQAEADCERSEISIMEATMETNEWITDTAPRCPLAAPGSCGSPKHPPAALGPAFRLRRRPRPTFLPGRSSLTKTWNISKRWWRFSPCLRTSRHLPRPLSHPVAAPDGGGHRRSAGAGELEGVPPPGEGEGGRLERRGRPPHREPRGVEVCVAGQGGGVSVGGVWQPAPPHGRR